MTARDMVGCSTAPPPLPLLSEALEHPLMPAGTNAYSIMVPQNSCALLSNPEHIFSTGVLVALRPTAMKYVSKNPNVHKIHPVMHKFHENTSNCAQINVMVEHHLGRKSFTSYHLLVYGVFPAMARRMCQRVFNRTRNKKDQLSNEPGTPENYSMYYTKFTTISLLFLLIAHFQDFAASSLTCTRIYAGFHSIPRDEYDARRGACMPGTFLQSNDLQCLPMTDAVDRKRFKECKIKYDCTLGEGIGNDILECIRGSCQLPKNIGDACSTNEQCITQVCRNQRCDYAQMGESCSPKDSSDNREISCAPGLRCNGNQKCVRLSKHRETCKSNDNCESALYCDTTPSGDPVCLRPLDADQQCRPGSAPCKEKFFCKKDATQSYSSDVYTCKPQQPMHEYCEGNDWCKSSKANPVVCRNNRCEPVITFGDLGENSPCLHNRDCAEGITCANGICTRAEKAQCFQDSHCHTGADTSNICFCTPTLISEKHKLNGTCTFNCDQARAEYDRCTFEVFQEENIAWKASYYAIFHPRCCSKFHAFVNCQTRWINSFYPGTPIPSLLECPVEFNTGALVGVVLGVMGGSAGLCLCCILVVVLVLASCGGCGALIFKSKKGKRSASGEQWMSVADEGAPSQNLPSEQSTLLG